MGCSASVFERQRPSTLPTALASLGRLEAGVVMRPGMQPDWIVVASAHQSWLTRNADGSTRWVANAADRHATPSMSAMALTPLSDEMSIQGTLEFFDSNCLGVTLAFAALQPGGRLNPLSDVRRRPGEDGHFDLRLPTRGAERLLLSVLDYGEGSVTDSCLVTLDSLRLHPVGP
jgi:hypothetical protein